VVDLFLLAPVLVVAWVQTTNPARRATAADIAAHCRDFPHSPLCMLQAALPSEPAARDVAEDISVKPSERT
jgi:hypothetical protein